MSAFLQAFGSLGGLLGSSARSASSDILSSGLSALNNWLFGGVSAKRNWKYQQKQMALQQQYNLETMAQEQAYNEANMAKQFAYQQQAWQMQNEYNDPSAVRERYERAGIAPQAALGGGATGAGLADVMDTPSSQNPSGSSPSGSANYSGNAVDPMMLTQLSAQAALADKYKAEADKTRSETYDNALNVQMQRAKLRYTNALAELAENQRVTEEQKARLTRIQADLEDATFTANVSMANSKSLEALEQLNSIRLDNQHKQFENEHQAEEFYAKLDVLESQALEYRSRAALAQIQGMREKALIDLTKEEIRKTGVEADKIEEELGFLRKEIQSQLPYLDEKARLQVEALAAQNLSLIKQANAAEKNANANWRRANHEVWQNWIKTACNVAGTVATYGMGGSFVKSSPAPTIYGAGGNVIGPQGQLQGWNK